jgi:hypothetical protein
MEGRDEGYSPSPNTEIDKDEGYSPSPGSISIFCDQNSLFPLSVLPQTREFPLSSLHFLRRSPSVHHTSFLSSLSKIVCGLNLPVRGQVRSLTDGKSAPSLINS